MEIRAKLRNIRREILEEIDKIDSALDLYNIQKKIILEIIDFERKYFNTSYEAYREHVLLLRNYGDTIPWLVLEQKKISEINDSEATLTFLSNDLENIMHVLEEGKKYALNGNLVVLGASTNLFFGTDIVICDNRDNPICVKIYGQNRDGRKIVNFQDLRVNKSIRESCKEKYFTRFCMHRYRNEKLDIGWKKINDSISRAILEGEGYSTIEDGNLVWAFKYNGDMPDMNDEIRLIIEKYNKPMIGSHFTILDEPELMMPPPSCWPIELENRMALVEGDIALMHYIDVNALKNVGKDNGYIKDILYHGNNLEENCIVVSSINSEKIYSSKYINDILYGFCRIGDIANYLIDSTSVNI